MSETRHRTRFTPSNLEKYDWQAFSLSTLTSRTQIQKVDTQPCNTPERGQDASSRLTTGKPHALSTQRHFACFGEMQKPGDEQRGLNGVNCTMHKLIATAWQRPLRRTRQASSRCSLDLQRTRLWTGICSSKPGYNHTQFHYIRIDTPSTEMRDLEIAKGVC